MHKVPEHLRSKLGRARLKRLRAQANGLRAYYGVPIYLVGSALQDANEDPRDWDIRIMLPDARFQKRFGSRKSWETEGATGEYTKIRWRWSDECVKHSKVLSSRTGLNCDVQIFPASYARERFPKLPKLQLDTRRTGRVK